MAGGHGHESHGGGGGGGGHSKKEDATGWAIFIGVTTAWDPGISRAAQLKEAIFSGVPAKIEGALNSFKEAWRGAPDQASVLAPNAQLLAEKLNPSLTEQVGTIESLVKSGNLEAAQLAIEKLEGWTKGVGETLNFLGSIPMIG